jgi:FkbM family methyltransferase
MNTVTLEQSPLMQWLDNFLVRCRFKFLLPRVNQANLENIKLDISTLSSVMKNNVLLGRYEVQERRMASKHLKWNDSVLELGGAIGFIGLFCQKNIGITDYTTIEANPETAQLLKANYMLNGMTPTLWNVAASSEDGEIELNIGNEFWSNSIVDQSGNGRKVTVPSLSLPSILTKLGYEPTTLICDIEGAEQYLDFKCLPASTNKIIIELHPDIIGESEVHRIIMDLQGIGFHTEEEQAGTYLFLRI